MAHTPQSPAHGSSPQSPAHGSYSTVSSSWLILHSLYFLAHTSLQLLAQTTQSPAHGSYSTVSSSWLILHSLQLMAHTPQSPAHGSYSTVTSSWLTLQSPALGSNYTVSTTKVILLAAGVTLAGSQFSWGPLALHLLSN